MQVATSYQVLGDRFPHHVLTPLCSTRFTKDRACQDEAYVQDLLRKSAKKDKECEAIASAPGLHGTVRRFLRSTLEYLRFLPFLRDEERESLRTRWSFAVRNEDLFDSLIRHAQSTVTPFCLLY